MYEVTGNDLSSSLTSGNSAVFTKDTVNLIVSLATATSTEHKASITELVATNTPDVTVPSGSSVALVTISNTGTTTVKAVDATPVVVFNSATGSVNAEFNDASNSLKQRVIVTPGGNNNIVIKDNVATQINASTGNDTIVAGGANDTVVVGTGNDTVDGGKGYDVIVAKGNATDYNVTVQNGHMVLSKTSGGTTQTIDTHGVQYVQLDNGKAIIAAADAKQAALAVLYETVFGRTADASGLEYWIKDNANGNGETNIAQAFVNIGGSQFSNLSNDQFVEMLYQNAFKRASDADGKAYWVDQLAHGHTRGELAAIFSDIAVHNFDNPNVTTVGYVKIVDGLI
jgi:hypothetical protein